MIIILIITAIVAYLILAGISEVVEQKSSQMRCQLCNQPMMPGWEQHAPVGYEHGQRQYVRHCQGCSEHAHHLFMKTQDPLACILREHGVK